jgi:hypothetical protein
MKTNFYLKGTALILTEGEYSDYGICSTLVTIEDCDLPALAARFLALHVDESAWDRDPSEFAAWLVTEGLAMPMKAEQVHIGSYGRLEL